MSDGRRLCLQGLRARDRGQSAVTSSHGGVLHGAGRTTTKQRINWPGGPHSDPADRDGVFHLLRHLAGKYIPCSLNQHTTCCKFGFELSSATLPVATFNDPHDEASQALYMEKPPPRRAAQNPSTHTTG